MNRDAGRIGMGKDRSFEVGLLWMFLVLCRVGDESRAGGLWFRRVSGCGLGGLDWKAFCILRVFGLVLDGLAPGDCLEFSQAPSRALAYLDY